MTNKFRYYYLPAFKLFSFHCSEDHVLGNTDMFNMCIYTHIANVSHTGAQYIYIYKYDGLYIYI